jgi:hypothetical protein
MEILFISKKRISSYGEPIGLHNSMNFTANAVREKLVPDVLAVLVEDYNRIDSQLHLHKPKICIIEAIWVTPAKLKELARLHPDVRFVIRVHSKIPFLSMEGIALEWLIEYSNIDNVEITFNNVDTASDFKGVTQTSYFLPNIYLKPDYIPEKPKNSDGRLKIGCFGALRPLKNQLIQAFAAMEYAERNDAVLKFYINSNRIEQNAGNILKNIRSLFAKSKHSLEEIDWLPHNEFVKVIAQMDMNMQCSFTESFNIVTADSVYCGVPVVVSPDIAWMNSESQANPNDMKDIVKKLTWAEDKNMVLASKLRLDAYNLQAIDTWSGFLQDRDIETI